MLFLLNFSAPVEYQFTGVQTGFHTLEILAELGYDKETISNLSQKQTVKWGTSV